MDIEDLERFANIVWNHVEQNKDVTRKELKELFFAPSKYPIVSDEKAEEIVDYYLHLLMKRGMSVPAAIGRKTANPSESISD